MQTVYSALCELITSPHLIAPLNYAVLYTFSNTRIYLQRAQTVPMNYKQPQDKAALMRARAYQFSNIRAAIKNRSFLIKFIHRNI